MNSHGTSFKCIVEDLPILVFEHEDSSFEGQLAAFRTAVGVLLGYVLSGACSDDEYVDAYHALVRRMEAESGLRESTLELANLEDWESIDND